MDKIFFVVFFSLNLDSAEVNFYNSSAEKSTLYVGIDSGGIGIFRGKKNVRNAMNYQGRFSRGGKRNCVSKSFSRMDTVNLCPYTSVKKRFPVDSNSINRLGLDHSVFCELIFVDQFGNKIRGFVFPTHSQRCENIEQPKIRRKY